MFTWGSESYVFQVTSYHLRTWEWKWDKGSQCKIHFFFLQMKTWQAGGMLGPALITQLLQKGCWAIPLYTTCCVIPQAVFRAPHSQVHCELPITRLKPQQAKTVLFESACSTTQCSPQGHILRKWNSNHPVGMLFIPFPDNAQRCYLFWRWAGGVHIETLGPFSCPQVLLTGATESSLGLRTQEPPGSCCLTWGLLPQIAEQHFTLHGCIHIRPPHLVLGWVNTWVFSDIKRLWTDFELASSSHSTSQ